MAVHQLTCRTCAAQFTYHRRKTYCSFKCRPSVPAKLERVIACYQVHTCGNCGSSFQPKRAGRIKFCSRECAFEFLGKQAELKAKTNVSFTVLRNKCTTCGSRFERRGLYCSDRCRPPAYVAAAKIARPCITCGIEVVGTAAKRECAKCQRLKMRHLRKAKGRAAHYGVEYQPINPIKVLERDGWRCQVCGVKTPKRLRGTFKPNAPEVDHRVPLAMGGGHTWDNVQCCCRSCNGVKGSTRVLGQMSLFSCVDV